MKSSLTRIILVIMAIALSSALLSACDGYEGGCYSDCGGAVRG